MNQVMKLSISNQVTTLLNGSIYAFKEILPNVVDVKQPSTFTDHHIFLSYSVLVGMVGDFKGRIILDADQPFFEKLCQTLYGFQLEGDLLESFVGEFGNMVAGKLCSYSSEQQIHLDITPPTVMIGQTQIPNSPPTFSLPITINEVGSLNVLLTIEN